MSFHRGMIMNTVDMIYDLSSIWAAVSEEFPYFDRLNFNWDDHYRNYLGKVMQVTSEKEFHKLLTEFLAELKDGHTKYIPPAEFRESKPFVRPDKPSYSFTDGVLTIKINEFLCDYSEYVKNALESTEGISLVRLDIRDNIGGNTIYAAKVAELFISGVFHACQKWTQIHNAVDAASCSLIAGYSEERLQKYINDGIMTKDAIADALKVVNRTNYEEYVDSFGSENNTAVYDGPLEVLISRRTMSAAEDFASMFRSSHRADLVGEPTFGSTGTPYHIPLRCGGRAQVVSVGYRLLDGTEFIGKGIVPDRNE